jgi:predicted hydrolase (HD superfamily)
MKSPITAQEDRMENALSIIGAITGVAGLLVAVLIVWRQEKVHARELAEERARHDRELAAGLARNERSERLVFLSDRIFDISIPRNLRQPFYEEYISMKGNGTAVKFWLMEGEMKK